MKFQRNWVFGASFVFAAAALSLLCVVTSGTLFVGAVDRQSAELEAEDESVDEARAKLDQLVLKLEKRTKKVEHLEATLRSGPGFSVACHVNDDLEIVFDTSSSGELVVEVVRPGGAAWFAGVQEGDVIQSIDGVSTVGMTAKHLVESLNRAAVEEISIVLASDPSAPVTLSGELHSPRQVTAGLGIGFVYADRVDGVPQLNSKGLPLPKVDENGYPLIVSVMDGKPAARSGIRKDDAVTTVDGVSTVDMDIDQLFTRLAGEEGDIHTLGIEDRKTDVVVELKPLK